MGLGARTTARDDALLLLERSAAGAGNTDRRLSPIFPLRHN